MDETEFKSNAVRVVNAFKSYTVNAKVLKGLNLNVPSGCIYGLLGPSGCGKTTLLSSIIGFQSLDSGTISVQTENRSDIGYMPQELSLDDYLTVREILEFYGSLYNMSEKLIHKRINELQYVLELHFLDSYIKNLSGGQCRRASLAVSLLHDPKIIILDEPTVGLDPILSHNIWKYFVNLVKTKGKTIIITTHYIQEAHQADIIGLMINGKILEESSPKNVLEKYETDNLETAFLRLCEEQKDNTTDQPGPQQVNSKNNNNNNNNNEITKKMDSGLSKHRIRTLFKKNRLVTLRDYVFYFNMLLIPTFQIFNFNINVGGRMDHGQIAINNDEVNFSQCKNSNYMDYNGCIFDKTYNANLSCHLISILKSLNYDILELNDRNFTAKDVERSNVFSYLRFHKNFTRGIRKYILREQDFSYEDVLYSHIPNRNLLIKQQITFDLIKALNILLGKEVKYCNKNAKLVKLPMEIVRLVGEKVKTLRHYSISFIIALTSYYFSCIYSGSFMITEKTNGLLNRSMLAGVTTQEVIISLLCIQIFLCAAQFTIQVFVSFVIFSNPVEISSGLLLYVTANFFVGWIGFFYGIVCAGISNNCIEVVFLALGCIMGQLFVGGVIWPIEAQHYLVQLLSTNIPMTVAGRLMSNVSLRGWTLTNPEVMEDFIKTIVLFFAHIGLLYCLKFIKKDPWSLRR
ncbi:ABC transporter G family member 20-like isoform X2 [Daktulosphaira vitifoliae]|uniref:ABC transporter G family member 20-like isoform X2 n=1 Tax=Daktulosphaira vitifoliae TaxID=58002 RepID=UPI0021AA5545|nr:ABC transporter G family member 20-like isoform X2 [Daktulosphaira vitifoliae]